MKEKSRSKLTIIVSLCALTLTFFGCSKDKAIPETSPKAEVVKTLAQAVLLTSPEFGSYYAKGSVLTEGNEAIKTSGSVKTESTLAKDLGPNEARIYGGSYFQNRNNIFYNGSMLTSEYSNGLGGSRVVNNGLFYMDFQADGNFVLYKRLTPESNAGSVPLWASGKLQPWPNVPSPYSYIDFTGNGDVYCHSSNGVSFWGAGLPNVAKPIWILQYDGNFVGYTNYQYINIWHPPMNPDAGPWEVVITGEPFASTYTHGGIQSPRSGKLR